MPPIQWPPVDPSIILQPRFITGPSLPPIIRSRIVRLLLLDWCPDAIADEVHCHVSTVYRMLDNMFRYGTPSKPHFRVSGCPRKITVAAEKGLLAALTERPWLSQTEMVWYLWEEWGLNIHRSTVSRVLKRAGWNRKKAQRLGERRNEELRRGYIADMLNITTEQMVFIDESLFNETTGWRHYAYAPIEQPGRYHASRTRGHSWSILPAYTIDGFLPCTGVKEGWFNGQAFYRWVSDELLPQCNPYPQPKSVIIMDNASIHCNQRIEQVRNGGVRLYIMITNLPS